MGNSIIKPAVTRDSPITAFEGFLLYDIQFDITQKYKNMDFWQIRKDYNQAKENMRNLHFRKFMLFRDFALNNHIPKEIIKIFATEFCSKLLKNECEAEKELKMIEICLMHSK